MISKEQIAHDLAMIYMQNRYGINVSGNFYMSDNNGAGNIETVHFPAVSEPQYTRVGTGEKGFLGFEKKQVLQSGSKVDTLFEEMVINYYDAYSHFYQLLCKQSSGAE